jgi:hypothetical protein
MRDFRTVWRGLQQFGRAAFRARRLGAVGIAALAALRELSRSMMADWHEMMKYIISSRQWLTWVFFCSESTRAPEKWTGPSLRR